MLTDRQGLGHLAETLSGSGGPWDELLKPPFQVQPAPYCSRRHLRLTGIPDLPLRWRVVPGLSEAGKGRLESSSIARPVGRRASEARASCVQMGNEEVRPRRDREVREEDLKVRVAYVVSLKVCDAES
jgi:hypothetical protein